MLKYENIAVVESTTKQKISWNKKENCFPPPAVLIYRWNLMFEVIFFKRNKTNESNVISNPNSSQATVKRFFLFLLSWSKQKQENRRLHTITTFFRTRKTWKFYYLRAEFHSLIIFSLISSFLEKCRLLSCAFCDIQNGSHVRKYSDVQMSSQNSYKKHWWRLSEGISLDILT